MNTKHPTNPAVFPLDDFLANQKALFDYFGYVENWKAIPVDDCRDKYWRLNGIGPGSVYYADSEQELAEESGQFFSDEIYTQRHLDKWVYEGADFTMICCDPGVDGNHFLRIFDNSKKR